MAQTNPIKFLLNQESGDQVVSAPAFSLTKVLSAGAVIVTPLAAVLVKALNDNLTFTSSQVVTLMCAVLAFLAIAGSADVIGRSIATASQRQKGHVALAPALDASLIKTGEDAAVKAIAVRRTESGPEFLVVEDDSLTWQPANKLRFAKP